MVEEFLRYTGSFDGENDKIKNKIAHTMRVKEMMTEFAEKLCFSEDEVELAGEIGLLHDIGRFEQAKRANTYNDYTSFDHAEFGADLLFKEGLIDRFDIKKSHHATIEFAIRQHNKLTLDTVKDEKTMKMARLIRDVDKLDILYNLGTLGRYDLKGDHSEISPLVMKDVLENRPVDRKNTVTNNDKIVADFGFAFDLNYDISLEIVRKYLQVLYNRVEYEGIFKNVYEHVIGYLDERIEKIC